MLRILWHRLVAGYHGVCVPHLYIDITRLIPFFVIGIISGTWIICEDLFENNAEMIFMAYHHFLFFLTFCQKVDWKFRAQLTIGLLKITVYYKVMIINFLKYLIGINVEHRARWQWQSQATRNEQLWWSRMPTSHYS